MQDFLRDYMVDKRLDDVATVDKDDFLLLKALRAGQIGPVDDPNIRRAIVDLEKRILNSGRGRV